MKIKILALGGLASVLATVAHAQSGSLSLYDTTSPSFSGGNDITNAVGFTINNYISNTQGIGIFTGLASQDFGSVTFSTANGSSLTFGDASFGTFASSQIIRSSIAVGAISYNVLGSYTSGTFDGGAISGQPAILTISFTETPSQNGSVSDSATFSTPPIPEPTTLALTGMGGLVGLLMFRRRK